MLTIRFSESRAEWLKTVAAVCAAVSMLAGLAWWKGWANSVVTLTAVLACLGVFCTGCVHPPFARTLYRGARRFGAFMGLVVGTLVLAILYILVVLPMGLGLRLAGKDLLGTSRHKSSQTAWHKVSNQGSLDQMF